MKRFLPFLAIVLFAVVSCEDPDVNVDKNDSRKISTFEATIVESLSRTQSTILSDGVLYTRWHSEDVVALTNGIKSAKYNIKSGSGSAKANFSVASDSRSVSFAQADVIYGVSPASALSLKNSKSKLAVEIPSAQTYTGVAGQNDNARNIMLGLSDENLAAFEFAPILSAVCFDIKVADDEQIFSVSMQSEGVALSGSADIDLRSLSIATATADNISLSYQNPAKGTSIGGWAAIAPVDFTSTTSKVFYAVSTNLGVYTFCYNPQIEFVAGTVNTVKLSVAEFAQVADKDSLEQGKYYYNSYSSEQQPDTDPEPEVDANLNVRTLRKTDSTISIGWTITAANLPYVGEIHPNSAANYTVDMTKTYKVAIYRDMACTDLVMSVAPVKRNEKDDKELFSAPYCPPRFVFSGLEPSTTYYIKVTNVTDNKTNATPLQVTTMAPVADKNAVVTTNARVGDMILFENFSMLKYAADVTSRSAGVSRTDRNKLTSYEGADLKGEITTGADGYYMVAADTEIGLFNTLKGLVDDMGLDKWGWIGGSADATGGSVCARSGYVKISTNKNRSFICTPALNAIPKGKLANLRVIFNAAPYGGATEEFARADEKYMSVKALAGAATSSTYAMTYSEVVDEKYIDLQGDKVCDWKEYTVMLNGVPSGSSIALGGGLEATAVNRMFLDDIRIFVESLSDAPEADVITGTVKYSDGTPAAGISVSDGFSVVQTAADGTYSLTPVQDTWYIYYSVPADCEVPINNNGQPAFFTRYSVTKSQYDFTLTKLAGGKETNFSLFCLADPQCKDSDQRDRFNTESVPDIKAHAATKGMPCYGVTLGDVAYSEGNRNCESQMPYLRGHMSKNNIGMPIFQTMGNHDYTYFNSSSPISADETSSTYNMKAQRAFENVFGPIDYSWNRGDVHIVCMRNMQWNSNTDAANYSLAFSDAQYKWLQQDLAAVPKDKMVILCVHIPLTNSKNKNIQNVIALLKQFKEAHIMSGHTHYMRQEPTLSGGVFEHVHAAVCGNWWYSRVNGDGCPNGYGVYDIEGNTIKNWYYKGTNAGMNDRDYQMRLYRGNHKSGGSHEYIQLQHGDGVIIANVFNADPSWEVKVYENGVYAGKMTFMPNNKQSPTAGTSEANPTKPSTSSTQDWWAIGYHVGVIGRGHVGGSRANYLTNGFHLYKYTLKDKNAEVRVEATDRFGRTYSCSEFTGDYDYSLMTK